MKLNFQSNLNFKAVVPKIKLQVQNKKTGENVPATFYEIDCKDKLDCLEFKKLGKDWWYAQLLCESTLGNYYRAIKNNYQMRHYEIKTDDDETIAICRTWQTGTKSCDIEYLESKPNSLYRFAGQAMLASIAKEELRRGCEKLTVMCPIQSAYSFYEETCGFKEGDCELKMDDCELEEFIEKTQKEIKHKLEEI